jgi:hypothetical protein
LFPTLAPEYRPGAASARWHRQYRLPHANRHERASHMGDTPHAPFQFVLRKSNRGALYWNAPALVDWGDAGAWDARRHLEISCA